MAQYFSRVAMRNRSSMLSRMWVGAFFHILVADLARQVLDRGSLPTATYTPMARRLMQKLSEARDQLPTSLFTITVNTPHLQAVSPTCSSLLR
jgi:hypothetical protein